VNLNRTKKTPSYFPVKKINKKFKFFIKLIAAINRKKIINFIYLQTT